MDDDWFRSPDWSADAREDFEQRLRRARIYNRAQYLRIKGLALADAGEVAAARELWLRVVEDTDELAGGHKAGALEHLADSYSAEDSPIAETYYRRLLTEHPSLNGTTATQHIKLAELLLNRGSPRDLNEAAELLIRWADETHLPLPNAPSAGCWLLFAWPTQRVIARLRERLHAEPWTSRRAGQSSPVTRPWEWSKSTDELSGSFEDWRSRRTHLPRPAHVPMGLRLGPLSPRSRNSHAWSTFRVAVVAATGAVVTAWRTPARRA
jgi:hypothetical protein